jgi:hypothetical protein
LEAWCEATGRIVMARGIRQRSGTSPVQPSG